MLRIFSLHDKGMTIFKKAFPLDMYIQYQKKIDILLIKKDFFLWSHEDAVILSLRCACMIDNALIFCIT